MEMKLCEIPDFLDEVMKDMRKSYKKEYEKVIGNFLIGDEKVAEVKLVVTVKI